MKTLYHPTIPGVTATVPGRDVKAWRAQGWRDEPTTNVPAAEPDESTTTAPQTAANEKE